ncbi:MAG: DUF2975 domain-containing protein [Acutalibacteraceae bacterium]|jgi:hypothetical protein
MNECKSLKLALILTDIFFCLLIIATVALPWMVTWYVETMGRSPKLPAIIMVTCYPCVPFAGATLIQLRRIIKNVRSNHFFTNSNVTYLNRISIYCLVIAGITIIGGRFYLPFFIVGIAFAFFSLMVFSMKCVFKSICEQCADTDGENTTKPNI